MNDTHVTREQAPVTHANLTHAQRRWIVIGVLCPLFLGSLDQTILANALPTIGRDLGHVADLPWLITGYFLAATAATPLYGKLSDIRGRSFMLSVALLLYVGGSLICALAPNFYILVLGRVVHGIGGGGLISLAMVVLGDVASPKERGRYYTYFSVVFTMAGALGPLLGGLVSEHLHWRILFVMNVPLGLVALTVAHLVLRRLPRHERPHRLDLLGAVLIVAASVAFMLALNVRGGTLLALLAVAALAGVAFVARLLTAAEPLIPLAIFREPDARCAIVANAFGWGAIIGLNIYLPTYLQTVLGLTATQAGLSLMVLMVTVNVGAGLAGHIIGRVERYRAAPLVALFVGIAATLTLAARADSMTVLEFQLLLGLIGFGFGPVAPLSTVVLQNSVAIHQFGTAVGTMNFSRNLCGTILVAVFGAMVLSGLAPENLAAGAAPAASAQGFSHIFLAAAASFAVSFLAILLMKDRPLATTV